MNDTGLEPALQRLYDVFGKYPLKTIHACTCGCLPEDRVATLQTKPMQQLLAGDLGSYCNSAIWTWGDAADFKHFLPRILEMLCALRHETDIASVLGKLEVAGWSDWEPEEQSAVREYLHAWWREINTGPLSDTPEIMATLIDCLPDHEALLDVWDRPGAVLQNMVDFIFEESNRIINERRIWFVKIENPEFPDTYRRWLCSAALRRRLEQAFWEYADSDPELGARISVCLQLAEGHNTALQDFQ